MTEILRYAFNISLVLFMAGNLMEMGLRLELREAVRGLRSIRFLVLTLLFGFVFCPAAAFLITWIVPMEPAYALGLILLGMAPCAPYLPVVVDRAHGDTGFGAAFMLLTAIGTVLFMPVAVPLMTEGLSASAWTIARPLVFYILIPLAAGMTVHALWHSWATRIRPVVKTATTIATLVLLIVIIALHGKDLINAIGSYVIGAQILYFVLVAIVTHTLGSGLPSDQKSVLVLGLVSRNIGAAAVPLIAASSIDYRAFISVLLGLPITIVLSFLAAIWLGRREKTV